MYAFAAEKRLLNGSCRKTRSKEPTFAMARSPNGVIFSVIFLVFYLSAAAASREHRAFVRKTISSHDIVVFSKSYCPSKIFTYKVRDIHSRLSRTAGPVHYRNPRIAMWDSYWRIPYLQDMMYCKRAKSVFTELNKEAYVIELDQRDDGSDIQDALREIFGRRTVPQVFIHGKHVGGSDDTVAAYESGELAKLLGIQSDEEDDL